MKLLETTLTETTVRMRYADHADVSKASQWLEFQVPLAGMRLPLSHGEEEFGDDPDIRLLAEVRLAALRSLRLLIGEETRRLSQLRDPTLR